MLNNQNTYYERINYDLIYPFDSLQILKQSMKKTIIFFVILTISINSFAQNKNGRGLNFDDNAYKNVPMKAHLTRELYSTLPANFSLKKYAPIPKSQGSYGTCVGWSTAYAALTIADSKLNERTDKDSITANAFSPGFIYKQIKMDTDYSCAFGASIADALEIMKTKGAAKLSELSEENCPGTINHDIFKNAAKYKIVDYAKIFDESDDKKFKISSVKKSISQGNPVLIGMKCPDSFYDALEFWQPTESADGDFGGHAMCVIGYDDKKGKKGSFEIMNSWGDYWGNGGFVWIEYNVFSDFVKYAYEMIDMVPYKNNENTDMEGNVRFVKSSGEQSVVKLEGNIYKITEEYKSGTLFRLFISNSQPAFVYSFGSDATKQVFPIFPFNEQISPALTYRQNDVAIPDQDHFIQTDNTIGTDYLCVLYSKKPLDIKAIMKSVENGTGTFSENINIALGNNILSNSDIEFKKDKIEFKAKGKSSGIVPIIIATKHVE